MMNTALLERVLLYTVMVVLAIGYYLNASVVPVMVYNPETRVTEVVAAVRSDKGQQHILYESGFRNAVAMATASYPYQIEDPQKPLLPQDLLTQYFTDDLAKEVNRIRGQIGVFVPRGVVQLDYNPSMTPQFHPNGNGLGMEALFTQTVPQGSEAISRTWLVKAMGHLTRVTHDNTSSLKITHWKVTEIIPQTH